MSGLRAVVVGDDLIAHASARRLAVDGFEVLLAGDSPESVVATIATDGGSIHGLSVDVTLPEESAAGIKGAVADWPAVDALVNAQFFAELATVDNLSLESWQRSLAVNATGPLLVTQALRQQLGQSGRGSVVHLGSIDGLFGNPTVAGYSASKAVLVPLTHLMAHEYAPDGIRVNCIARALVWPPNEPGGDQSLPPVMAAIAAQTPLARAATPKEIAAVVSFLVSDESSYVTGTVIPVDGGRTGITRGTA